MYDPITKQGKDNSSAELPHPFNLDAVLVCVDVEGHCVKDTSETTWIRNKDRLTEVGLAWLDTRKIHETPPGDRGRNWFHLIQHRHWRVSDIHHIHLPKLCRKYRKGWHKGASDNFCFAPSHWVTLSELPTKFNALMEEICRDGSKSPRFIVPITFAAAMEEKTFKGHGLKLFDQQNSLRAIDTQRDDPGRLWTAKVKLGNQKPTPSLTKLSLDLGLADEVWLAKYLHNGGNDAVITLQGLIAGRMMTMEQRQAFGTYAISAVLPNCLPLLAPSWPAEKVFQHRLPRGVRHDDVENLAYQVLMPSQAVQEVPASTGLHHHSFPVREMMTFQHSRQFRRT